MKSQILMSKKPEIKDIREIDPNAHIVLSLLDSGFSIPIVSLRADLVQLIVEESELAFGILQRKPDKCNILEGRGVYYDLSSVGIKGRFVYVKGAGSYASFDNSDESIIPEIAKYHGFGNSRSNLYFDGTLLALHPRLLGTETLRWAGLEFINAYLVFRYLIEKYYISTLEQARELGITIPLSIAKFPELTDLVTESIQVLKAENKNLFRKESFDWPGNFEGMAALALEVPGNIRLDGSIILDNTAEEQRYKNIFNSKNYTLVSRTLRTLLEMGFVYSYVSSHAQNIYVAPNSICAQADNSDLLHLGALKQFESSEEGDSIQKNTTLKERQIFAIYAEIRSMFRPPMFMSEQFSQYYDSRDKSLFAYYSGLMNGELSDEVVNRLIMLMPMFDDEINAALVLCLWEKYNDQQWDQVAQQQQDLLGILEGVGIRDEYEAKKVANLQASLFGGDITHCKRRWDLREDIINSFVKYIQTSDSTHIVSLEEVSGFESFRDSISVYPIAMQERILYSIWRTNNSLEYWVDSGNLPAIWFQSRTMILTRTLNYCAEDLESGVQYIENIEPIIRDLGMRGWDCTYSDWPKIREEEGPGWGDEVEEELYRACQEMLKLNFPHKHGLKEGVKRQQYLINCGQFTECKGGFIGILEAFDDENSKNVYDLFEERGLRYPNFTMGDYFKEVFYSPKEDFERVHQILTKYHKITSTLNGDAEDVPRAVDELNALVLQLDNKTLLAWHYNYLSTVVFDRFLKDKAKQVEYRNKVVAELDALCSVR